MHTPHVCGWSSAQVQHVSLPVLTCIDNLHSLSLPSFDLRIVHHHSAFGLHHINPVPCRSRWRGICVTAYITSCHSCMYLLPPRHVYSSCLRYRRSHRLRTPSHIQTPIFSQILPFSKALRIWRALCSQVLHALSMLCSQYYCSPRPCTSCYPPGAIAFSSWRIYHHFHPDQSWVWYVLTLKNLR